MYIISLKKDSKTGEVSQVKELCDLERPDIVYQAPIKQVIKHLTEGKIKYATAIQVDGKYVKGDDLIVVNGYLKTKGNDTVLDNLENLPTFD